MATDRSTPIGPLVDDLQRIFERRLEAIVSYGRQRHGPVPTLALVASLSVDDLNTCAERAAGWERAGIATPLLLTRADFARSLDAFPIEYGEIIEHHDVVYGSDPFAGLAIRPDDLRRACEVQVKSHLLHLREDYIEAHGHYREIDQLVRESAPGFAALLRHLARLDEADAKSTAGLLEYAHDRLHLDVRVVGDLLTLADAENGPPIDTVKLFPDYLTVMERLSSFVDGWRSPDLPDRAPGFWRASDARDLA
jgi:hypothetical protein